MVVEFFHFYYLVFVLLCIVLVEIRGKRFLFRVRRFGCMCNYLLTLGLVTWVNGSGLASRTYMGPCSIYKRVNALLV